MAVQFLIWFGLRASQWQEVSRLLGIWDTKGDDQNLLKRIAFFLYSINGNHPEYFGKYPSWFGFFH